MAGEGCRIFLFIVTADALVITLATKSQVVVTGPTL